ncbi:PREDICTED: uncharacterized protein LOC104604416 isoform X2 [Nelumbo nucifera]|uniref:Uncharacterized protein LOC104604416 isoform X2 n=1 Tax=Nelumbo nucifera TaxID=4432 RepID=A0A1U8AV02_NELNU|nr:PREDICTED: uncharacterized protein LOC104604416 isoform X2 [Nelumbo nucifera]
MLRRSFKASKCKTSLKLAASRLKLLKNKRDAQVKQLKRELAQLLESGQDQTAKIRVEHVVREEKTMAAYDLIEIYCELVAARLPIIESQKNCPIDLKEAISSLIFASKRCADVPELSDVCKRFTKKYGKEFVASALELHPECGVNRTLVENLSARAPDGQLKIKILTSIAQEYNIDWDPNRLEEKDPKPPEDLLNGPSTFEAASKLHEELPDVPLNPVLKQESTMNIPDNNVTRLSLSSHAYVPTNTSTLYTTVPATTTSESGIEGREFHKHNWNMEFKDATSAAQAAAESAERASIAARAAAELSRQYSSESQGVSGYGLRDGGPRSSTVQKLQEDPIARESPTMVHNSSENSHDMNPGVPNQPREINRQDNLPGATESVYEGHGHSKRSSSRSASSGSSVASADNDISMASFSKGERYSQDRSPGTVATDPNWHGRKPKDNLVGEVSTKGQSTLSEVYNGSHQEQSKKTENTNHYGEECFKKRSSSSISSYSHGSASDDDGNDDVGKYKNDGGEWSFINTDQEMQRGTNPLDSAGYPPAVFDDYGSDDDHHFEAKPNYNRHVSDFCSHSSGRKPYSLLSATTNAQRPRKNKSESLESTAESPFIVEPHSPSEHSDRLIKSEAPSQSDDLLPVTYDNSDTLDSESEGEKDNFELYEKTESSTWLHGQNIFISSRKSAPSTRTHISRGSTIVKEDMGVNRRPIIESSFDDSDSKEDHIGRREERNLHVGRSTENYGQINSPTKQPPPRHTSSPRDLDNLDHELPLPSFKLSLAKEAKAHESFGSEQAPDITKSPDISNLSSSESGQELNFGLLTGGLRNKGYRRPPYTKVSSGNSALLSQQQAEDTPTIKQPIVSSAITNTHSSESCDEELHNQKMHIKVNMASSSRASETYTASDSSDTEEVPHKESYMGRRLSHRRKDYPKQSEPCDEETNSQKMHNKVHKKSSVRTSRAYFDSDSDDTKETPHQTIRNYTGSTLSRRTKDSPNESEIGRGAKFTVGSKGPAASEFGIGKKLSSWDSTADELPAMSEPKAMSLGDDPRTPRANILGGQEPSKSMPQSKFSVHKEAWGSNKKEAQVTSSESRDVHKLPRTNKPIEQKSFESIPESKFSVTKESSASYEAEPVNKLQPQTVSSGSRDDPMLPRDYPSSEQYTSKPMRESNFSAPKTRSIDSSQLSSAVEQLPNPLLKKVPSKSSEDSVKKTSHVHPKLPDYDSFAAHFHSLRSSKR